MNTPGSKREISGEKKKAKSGPGNKNRSSLLFMFVDICGKQDTRYIWLGGVRMLSTVHILQAKVGCILK